jgi:hypothetical protein
MVVADQSLGLGEKDRWAMRCGCGAVYDGPSEELADVAAAAHREVCPGRHGGLVALAEVPPFRTPPSVVLFGERIFELQKVNPDPADDSARRLRGDARVYVEAEFAYALPSTMVLPLPPEETPT